MWAWSKSTFEFRAAAFKGIMTFFEQGVRFVWVAVVEKNRFATRLMQDPLWFGLISESMAGVVISNKITYTHTYPTAMQWQSNI